MTHPAIPVSVIVVSRHRTQSLLRTITGIAQSDHPRMELIVVADPAGADAVAALPLAIKLVRFDAPNISVARNAGLARASAPVVAFVDDDAVPEPTWASRLSAVFADPRVVQAGGFVRGRDGLCWQSRAMEVDALGQDHPLDAGDEILPRQGTRKRSLKTQGTNCAFRAVALRAAGGFDPTIRFFLDDADVNLRLAEQGLSVPVPGAVVHHGIAASTRRRTDRVPTDLSEIGASLAVFLRRHATPGDLAPGLARLAAGQRLRLLRLMVSGGLEPGAVTRLMASLGTGWKAGLVRELLPLRPLPEPTEPFLPRTGTGPRSGLLLWGPVWQRARLRREATAGVAAGNIVTVLCLWPHRRRARHIFDPAGFWRHEEGSPALLRQALHMGRLNPCVLSVMDEFASDRPLCGAYPARDGAKNGTTSPMER